MKRRLTVLMLAAATCAGTAWSDELIRQGGQWVQTAEPAMGTPEGELAIIRRDFDDGQYAKVVSLAKGFAKRYGDSDLLEQAYNFAGRAQMRRGRHWQAFELFDKQLGTFPTGRLYEQTLAREADIADAFLAGKKRPFWGIFRISARDDGLEILERIVERVPGTPLAARALMTTGDYYFGRAEWADATTAYDRYQRAFGGKYQTSEAELKAAKSLFNDYRGPAFDDTPLVEAEQRFQAFAAQYPQQARTENVQKILTRIEQDKARKDYEVARFYARVGRSKAAAFYYRQVIDLHPGTSFAEASSKALSKMGLDPNPTAGQGVAP